MNDTAQAPLRGGRLPAADKDHFIGLEGAAPVATDAVRATEALIQRAMARAAMACVHGRVGLGKTFAVNAACRKLAADTTLVLQFAETPHMPEIRAALWSALDLPGQAPTNTPHLCDEQIKKALAASYHLLLFDEVQHLGRTALEYVRDIWDTNSKTTRNLSVILVGSANTRQKILHCEPLHNRIHKWQQFSPLTPSEVLNIIPSYHPLWRDTHDSLLLWIDDRACHGCFRAWANLTVVLQDALEDDPNLNIDKDLLRWALGQLDPTTRFPGTIEASDD
ncbi:ATP-binding protein [Streptomyces sp. NPDC006733]|uniref:ATP-binding protein n=1 Tax=Streptomyces sp. NPDC006733 TaxID=3155460 RepID=UPI0033D98051